MHKKVEIIESLEEFDNLKQQYSDKLVFECDGTIRLPFYATAWDRVLNIDGVMKIGNTLYKFEKDREYIIMDGGADDLKNLASLVNDANKVRVFFPNVKINQQNLKSIAWGELDYLEFATGNNYGHDRIKAYLQLVNYNYTGYGYTNVYYTEGGFDLRIRIDAQRKGIFGWYSNKVVYNLRNNYLNMSFYKLYNGGEIPEGVIIYPSEYDPRVNVNINLNDYTSSDTNQGLRYSYYYYYYDCKEGYYPPIEPKIFNFTTTFWTSDIGEGNKKTFTYSNI